MAGSSFGSIFRITTWGESHGPGIGVVVDGCPAGLPLSAEDIQQYLNRRKPGQTPFSTPRKESDTVEILSGIFQGKTTGTPISMLVRNTSQRSADYSEIASYYRPGHADFTFDSKYGFRDYRGGGRSSGRETIGRVAAGAVAAVLLSQLGISLFAYTKSIGPVSVSAVDPDQRDRNPLCMPDAQAAEAASAFLQNCMKEKDSAGGIVECTVTGLPAGLGDPVFEKLDANLAKAMLSIGSVKGFEIGEGMNCASLRGTENNDCFLPGSEGSIRKATNHSGGVLGGISDGSSLVFRAAIKPTPSISSPQQTVTRSGDPITVSIKGRHDPVIVPRAVVVVECMAALVVADALLSGMSSRMEYVRKIWE